MVAQIGPALSGTAKVSPPMRTRPVIAKRGEEMHSHLTCYLTCYVSQRWLLALAPGRGDLFIVETPRSIKPRHELHSQVTWKAEIQARLNLRADPVQEDPF